MLLPDKPCAWITILSVLLAGCSLTTRDLPPLPRANTAATVPTTRPVRHSRIAAAIETAATRPAGAAAVLGPPYRADVPVIVQLVFEKNPDVAASREDMVSAIHGLEEFRANLSRLEPFTEVNSEYSDFPHRYGARSVLGEATAGIRKETFEGATFRIEGGGSASRVQYADPDEDRDDVDQGTGGVLRGRLEVPFVGSRKRQDRIISQAYQESSARKARLTYLKDFRAEVLGALSYYNAALLYQNNADCYARHVADLEAILKDPRLAEADRSRVQSVITDYEAREATARSYQQEDVRYLLAALGLEQDEELTLVNPEYKPSPFIARAIAPEGVTEMVDEARASNPTFRVLEDAIKDSELQRRLAVDGRFDVTAFVQGEQFPLGAVDFDDRLEGWTLSGGIAVSLNDSRVLTAARRKAEADIRAFRAKADAELSEIKRQIVTETESLQTDHERRERLLELIRQKHHEYTSRAESYLKHKRVLIDQVLESRSDLTLAEANLNSLLYGCRASEIRLQAALGVFYQMAGLSITDVDTASAK